ncbi:hypothetical protein [Mesorhizobium sp. CN2-181]|uniref:hypothetical protein n=1 Tax=Mesorhizobium yinganensis TaxID=3157707 RepID=UPI0032B7110E
MKRVSILVGAALLVLAGCTTGKEEYATAQTALEGSPKLRAMTIAECGKRLDRKSADSKEMLAAIMNVPTKSVVGVVGG